MDCCKPCAAFRLRSPRERLFALVGANGAGKTTLLRAIAGAHKLAGGHVKYNGVDISRLRAHRRVSMGIAMVPEGRRLFPGLHGGGNLLVAGRIGRAGPWNVERVLEAFPLLSRLL